MNNKISVIVVCDYPTEQSDNLINSFLKQTLLEKELLIMTDEDIEESPNVQVFSRNGKEYWEGIKELICQASGDQIIVMHASEYFFEDTSLEEMLHKKQNTKSQALVVSYVKNDGEKILFHRYGDQVLLRPIAKSGIAIVMNQYEELRSFYGVLMDKSIVCINHKNGQLDLFDTLLKAERIYFDTKAYYVIPLNQVNSLKESEKNDIDLPRFVEKMTTDNEKISGVINIALCIDNNYGRYLAPLLYSLHEQHQAIDVYLIYDELNEEIFLLIMDLQRVLTHLNIILKKIPKYLLLPIQNVQSVYTGLANSIYYRLFIPTLLSHLDRVIYMDVDMLVVNDLSDLYYTSFEGNYLVAVYDLPMVKQANWWATTLLGKYYDKYFNSGLLLMNLSLMRKNNRLSEMLQFISDNYLYLKHDDQDMLNIYYRGAVKYFPLTYNWMPFHYRFYNEKFEDLVILHFAGGPMEKPWQNYSAVNEHYTLLKNQYRIKKLVVDHLMNRQPKLAVFIEDSRIYEVDKHKIESILMQLEANLDLYIIYDECEKQAYLDEYDHLSPYIHLVAQKQKSRLQIIQEILQKDTADYVYCLFGKDYLDVDTALYQLTSLAKDYQADIVFSTYKRLDEAKGSFIFYNADGQISSVLPDDYESYQQRDFDNLQSLQGMLIRSSLLLEGMKEAVSSEQELMSILLESKPRIYYKDEHYWIQKI